jgi:hypothetical protein
VWPPTQARPDTRSGPAKSAIRVTSVKKKNAKEKARNAKTKNANAKAKNAK